MSKPHPNRMAALCTARMCATARGQDPGQVVLSYDANLKKVAWLLPRDPRTRVDTVVYEHDPHAVVTTLANDGRFLTGEGDVNDH